MEKALLAFAAALCVCAGCITGIMEGKVAITAVEQIGKNPDAASKIQSGMIIAGALVEGATLFAIVVCVLAVLG